MKSQFLFHYFFLYYHLNHHNFFSWLIPLLLQEFPLLRRTTFNIRLAISSWSLQKILFPSFSFYLCHLGFLSPSFISHPNFVCPIPIIIVIRSIYHLPLSIITVILISYQLTFRVITVSQIAYHPSLSFIPILLTSNHLL